MIKQMKTDFVVCIYVWQQVSVFLHVSMRQHACLIMCSSATYPLSIIPALNSMGSLVLLKSLGSLIFNLPLLEVNKMCLVITVI